jgi:hypothetical protein
VIVLSEHHLKRVPISDFAYDHRWRTHRALALESSEPRAVQPSACGSVIEAPEVGGSKRVTTSFTSVRNEADRVGPT